MGENFFRLGREGIWAVAKYALHVIRERTYCINIRYVRHALVVEIVTL